jgi:DDE superfamily endonuclease
MIMTRDEEANRKGYSANSYLNVLNDQIEVCFKPSRTFIHDNASIHTAKKVKDWFENEGIPLLDWPPYSPDMNPIEHVWKKLKEIVHKRHPELINMGKSEGDLRALSTAIVEA